jgi:CspA family cold shock protein
MATGKVKWFNPQKGFGFIEPSAGGGDVFVHITAVQAAGLQGLDDGQEIEYELQEEKGKQSATNLKVAA